MFNLIALNEQTFETWIIYIYLLFIITVNLDKRQNQFLCLIPHRVATQPHSRGNNIFLLTQ